MAQKIKNEFVSEHGLNEWKNVQAYQNGCRTSECKNAWRTYMQIQQGFKKAVWTIYTVSEGDRIIYVGCTSSRFQKRVNHHKSRARTLDGAAPLHSHMNAISTDHDTFPEFTFQSLITTTDENAALALEKAYILAFKTNITGFNKKIGGGARPTMKTRPATTNQSIELR